MEISSSSNKVPLHCIYIPAVTTKIENQSCPTAERWEAIQDGIQEVKQWFGSIAPLTGPMWCPMDHLNTSDPNQQCPSFQLGHGAGLSLLLKERVVEQAHFLQLRFRYVPVIPFQESSLSSKGRKLHSFPVSVDGPNLQWLGRCLSVVDLSLTHRAAGSRTAYLDICWCTLWNRLQFCPCTNTNFNWPYQILSVFLWHCG